MDQTKYTKETAELYTIMKTHGFPLTLDRLAKLTNSTRQTTKYRVDTLIKDGLAMKVFRGTYAAVPEKRK